MRAMELKRLFILLVTSAVIIDERKMDIGKGYEKPMILCGEKK